MAAGESYSRALEQEKTDYENCAKVHDLPGIFDYWSNRYIRPKLLPFGFGSPNEMFLSFLGRRCAEVPQPRFASIGCGNGDLEVELAASLASRGFDDFVIDCLDVNPAMLERGRAAAQASGVAARLNFVEGDFNAWTPTDEYDAVMANQSLHHVTNLEGLFDRVKHSLRPGGSFLVSDMIGKNGHTRWPEALEIVHEFWRQLPPSYRFNRQLKRYEELYQDWDCSSHGFEGVRSQDVLPLLIERFHFHLFIPFGNVIDPFVDRSFGPNFDASAEWDRAFIDQVHGRDEREISAGRLTPTHMIAVLRNEAPQAILSPSPASCVRSARQEFVPALPNPRANYEWSSWPHSAERELEIACRRLAQCEEEIARTTAWAELLQKELENARKPKISRLRKEVKTLAFWLLAPGCVFFASVPDWLLL